MPETAASRRFRPKRRAMPASSDGLRDEGQAGVVHHLAERCEHRPVVDRLGRRNRCVRVAHQRVRDAAALQDHRRLDAEEGRAPQHEIGPLARLDRADVIRDAVGDRRVDRVLRDVALDAEIVVARRRRGAERAALLLHLVRGLPGPQDDLTRPTHRLAVRRHHRDRAEVVQDVLGRDRLAPDAALGERHVLGDRGSRWWQTISMSRCSSSVLTV